MNVLGSRSSYQRLLGLGTNFQDRVKARDYHGQRPCYISTSLPQSTRSQSIGTHIGGMELLG